MFTFIINDIIITSHGNMFISNMTDNSNKQ